MARRIVMIASVTLGIGLLAGLGWALLCLGVLIEVAWPREQPAWLPALVDRGNKWLAMVRVAPRRGLAAGLMVAGLVGASVGVLVAVGVGASLVVAGMWAGGLSLLLGWNS